MSVPSASVNIQVRFTPEALAVVAQLTENAILRAIDRAVARLTEFATSGVSPVPVDSGDLKASVAIAGSLRTIIMHWSSFDKGYDYAHVADVGRPNDMYIATDYSGQMREVGKQFLMEELVRELNTIQGALP